MKAGQKPEKLSIEERLEKLQNLFHKIDFEIPDASFAIGFPASENKEYASTSGLVSNIDIDTNQDDIYLSWIGAGLGIGVAGGYNLLINDSEITLKTFEGWKHYRKYLNDPSLQKLRGNQINSWNGQWLTYRLGNRFDNDFDFATLEHENIFKSENTLAEVNTVNWSNLFFSLSNLYPEQTLNTYIYSLGQTNKTIGFIPMYLKAGKKLKNVYSQLFHSETAFNNKEFQALFGMHIKRACELGNIGLHTLRPDNLKKYMEDAKNLSFKKEEDNIIYQSYKTWLIAMLSKNKEEITDYTLELAKLIQRYRIDSKGTEGMNLIKNDLLGAKIKKKFIEALTEMVNSLSSSDLETLKKLKDEVHLMTNEEFAYFNTLLKFDYAFIEKKS
ncbi:hypothetical protein [Sphingobacterium sp. IITKGP-BTPF85]|uniref:hypothetical protein n=1 Tax=Sphingobacterium sp. IITKGP-BTPF85 TaxID=1338009 RepID=UPI0004229189|nr:hypothetical protein [Sphingobacterium sp. IITKGP-BTPF85]